MKKLFISKGYISIWSPENSLDLLKNSPNVLKNSLDCHKINTSKCEQNMNI